MSHQCGRVLLRTMPVISGTAGQLPEPIIRQFKNEMEVTLRDGQTSESTVATDSMTGKVMKIEVSLSVLKSI